MATYPQGETAPTLDLLSVAIGAEFNECSIAAAELNKQVHARLDGGGGERVLYSVGEDPTIGQRFVTRLVSYACKTGGDEFSLALIKPANSLLGKRAIFRRLVERSVDILGNEPQLVAILGNEDAYVPLATFARRERGTCSYVQLGSEIRDDNLFVVASDEGTSRQDIIEKIRLVVGNAEEIPTDPSLATLLANELCDKEQLLDRAKEAMLVRRAYERGERPKDHAKLRVLDEKTGEFRQQDSLTRSLFYGLELGDGRVVNLTLSHGDNSMLQLLAVTRSDIALPIASFDQSDGRLDLYGLEQQLSPEQHRSIVSNLHHIVATKFKPATFMFTHNFSGRNESTRINLVIARHLHKRGLLDLQEMYDLGDGKVRVSGIDKDEVCQRIDEFLANPTPRTPYRSKALDVYVSSRRKRNAEGASACDLLDVASRLEAAIGPCSPSEELLFGKVSAMANKSEEFSAIAHDIQLGKTRGSAKVSAAVKRDGTFYSVIISGSPLAMPDEQPRPVLQFSFDVMHPLFDREKYTTDAAAEQRAKDILGILALFE